MSTENISGSPPKFNRARRGSVDDTIKDYLNPKLEFHQDSLPRGSSALQKIINQCEEEKRKEQENDSESDKDDDKIKRPSPAYMQRRRNTVQMHHGLENEFKKMSLAPIPEGERGRTVNHLLVPDKVRTRSLSPSEANKLRRNSMHHTDYGFGSTRARETRLK